MVFKFNRKQFDERNFESGIFRADSNDDNNSNNINKKWLIKIFN